MQRFTRILNESEADMESFHDCHAHGLRWRRDRFTFAMDIQYILEWLPPDAASSNYRFLICEARLSFRNVSDLRVSLDWSASALDAEIAAVRALQSRPTPNGRMERHFEIEFSDPDGVISLWSTGYELILLQEPTTSETPTIPLPNAE
jgi:hypothetical protein